MAELAAKNRASDSSGMSTRCPRLGGVIAHAVSLASVMGCQYLLLTLI